MYVMDISYFSGKLESYFNNQVTYISTLLLLQIEFAFAIVEYCQAWIYSQVISLANHYENVGRSTQHRTAHVVRNTKYTKL